VNMNTSILKSKLKSLREYEHIKIEKSSSCIRTLTAISHHDILDEDDIIDEGDALIKCLQTRQRTSGSHDPPSTSLTGIFRMTL
jgi:hypothetical protein